MKKVSLLLILFISLTCFSQTIEISQSGENQKFGLKNVDDGTMLTGFVYSKINSFNGNYFSCSLADTSFKGNCTLIDKALKPIIPYGQFSEFILSEDENYATVAGEENTIRLKENSYDTTTYTCVTKLWGVYDIKNKKVLLPLKYNYLSKVYKDGSIVFNSGGLAFMNDNFGHGGKFGIMNLKGEIVCNARYTYIGSYNDKDIAIAVVGGENTDGIIGGNYIAINKKGENIKPDFYIEPSPIIKKVYIETDKNQHLLYLKEIIELMNFKNEDDTLKRDSLFNVRYESDIFDNDLEHYGYDGDVFVISRKRYDIYEKGTKIDIWQPLPSKLTFNYNPTETTIKNWGKFLNYRNNFPKSYKVFNTNQAFPVASFYTLDSIFVSEFDSLKLDYRFPGIYNQNKRVLGKKYSDDIRTKKTLYKKLDEEGFVFVCSKMDSINYMYKLTCDTVETKMTICRGCNNEDEQFAAKYHYKKHVGLLVNEEVTLPPIYNYIVALNEFDYLLLDSTNSLWNYNIKSNTINKSNLTFDKIVNKRIDVEGSSFTKAILLLLKNPAKQFVAYKIDAPAPPIIFDSVKVLNEVYGIDNGYEMTYSDYVELTSFYNSSGNIVVFRGDSLFEYKFWENTLLFKDIIKNLFSYHTNTSTLELIAKPITLEKIKYNNYYFQKGFYLLETSRKKYVFSNSGFFTSNPIKVDSVVQLRPYLIYYNNNKMFLATYDGKDVIIQNKKVHKYYVTILDSAKQLELIDKYDTYDPRYYSSYTYDNANHDLYKADGVCKSITSKKVVSYAPTNYQGCKIENVKLWFDDKERGMLRIKSLYVISKNNMKYLCNLEDGELKNDSINPAIVIAFKDEQYVTLDSAKSFEIIKTNDNDNNYQLKGTYKADGILKSSTSHMALPIQNNDSLTVLETNSSFIEVYAFCKNGMWQILCTNMVKPEEFLVLDQWVFKSCHELHKTLYPNRVSNVECEAKTEQQVFKKKLEELSDKAGDDKAWK